MQNVPENTYQRYVELGGIINDKDYDSALSKLGEAGKEQITPDKSRMAQVQNMMDVAGIVLDGEQFARALKLYTILPRDIKPKEVKGPHDQLSDQQLFREVLRMLEDTDALNKLKVAYHTNRPAGTYCPLCHQTTDNENCT